MSPAHARQVWVVVLQTGVVPPHWAFETHGTQAPVVVKHAGVPPEHLAVLVDEHWAQAPLAWQAGVAVGQSTSPAQARQVWVVVLQTGVAPLQFAFDVQETQVAVAVSHAGVAPEHWARLVAEHWPQAPLD